MRAVRILLAAVAALAAMAALTASAWADDEPANSTNPVVSTTGSFPADFEALGEATELTTQNPNQGPFTCTNEIVGTIDNAAGDVTLDDVNVTQPGSVECGGAVDAFDFPWPGQACIEDNGGGNYTAWLSLQINDVATPLGDYGGQAWVELTPGQMSLPVGPLTGANIDESIPAFTPGDGPAHIVGDYSVDTLGADITAGLGTGACS
jgi:hypothetical protein